MVCERKECAEECLYQTPVIEVLLAPVAAQLSRPQVSLIYSLFLIWFLFFFFSFHSMTVTQQRVQFWKVHKINKRHVLSKLNSITVKPIPSWVSALKSAFDCLFFFFCGFQAKFKPPAALLTLIADVLARIANADGGLALFLQEKNVVAAHGKR